MMLAWKIPRWVGTFPASVLTWPHALLPPVVPAGVAEVTDAKEKHAVTRAADENSRKYMQEVLGQVRLVWAAAWGGRRFASSSLRATHMGAISASLAPRS